MAENQKIRLLRSNSTYDSLALAKEALGAAITEVGQIAIASYKEGDSTKVILGVVGNNKGKSYFTDTADIQNAILTSIKGGVGTDGDTLKKLYDLIKTETKNREAGDNNLLGTTADTSTADTIKGAKKGVTEAKDAAVAAKTAADNAQKAANAKVATVSGENAINVDSTTATAPKVSLVLDPAQGNVKLSQSAKGLKAEVEIPAATVTGVKTGDKVLALKGTELTSTISLSVDATAGIDGKKYIRLEGIDGVDLGKIDIADFVKDGMLTNAELVTDPAGQDAGTYIKLTWNTDGGKQPMYINVTSLIDVYTAGNGLYLNDHEFSVNTDVIATKDSVDKVTTRVTTLEGKVGAAAAGEAAATGLFKDVADNKAAIATEKDRAEKAEQANATAIKNLKDQVTKDAVTVKNAADDKYVTVTKAKDSNAYTVASKGIDTAIKTAADAVKVSVKAAEDAYVTGSVDNAGRVVTLSEKIQAVGTSSTAAQGLAEASDVKTYVDGKVNGKNVSAEGESGAAALVNASAADNKVTVTTTEKLKNAVTKAETALQSVSGATSGHITTTVSEKAAGAQTITVSAATKAVSGATSTADGLATAYDVKTYVDGLTGASHVVTAIDGKHGAFTFAAAGTKNSVNLSVSDGNVISAALTDIDCGTF